MTKPIATAHLAAGYERTIDSFECPMVHPQECSRTQFCDDPERYQVDLSAKSLRVWATESASIASLP